MQSPRLNLGGFALVSILAFMMPSFNEAAENSPSRYLATGRLRPAFDHLGGMAGQADAAAASGCNLLYATGMGVCSYTGLPPRAEMDALIARLREYNRKARASGAKIILSYLCATSIVNPRQFDKNWNDYFPNRPAEFTPEKMLQQDIHGSNLPSWYGGQYAPADMWNPCWRQYAKLTIKLAIESGHDGVFFDNPTVHTAGNYSPWAMKAWAKFLKKEGIAEKTRDIGALRSLTVSHPDLWLRFRATEAADFLAKMRQYGRRLKPGFLLTDNNSLNLWDSFYSQSRSYGYSIREQGAQEDFLTIEDMSGQPRRHGNEFISYGSTIEMIHAVSRNRPVSVCTTDGNYIAPPELMDLSIAECAAHDASYLVWSCWDKPFREAEISGAARYHHFLETNASLFEASLPAADFLLVWRDGNWLRRSDCPTAKLVRELSAANLQYRVITESDLTRKELKPFDAVVYSAEEGLTMPAADKLFSLFQAGGGRVISFGKTGAVADAQHLIKMLGGSSVNINGPAGVMAAARMTKSGECVLHLYNLNVARGDTYHDSVTQAENVRVAWLLPRGVHSHGHVRLLSPDDAATTGWREAVVKNVNGREQLEFVVPKLFIWSVAIVE